MSVSFHHDDPGLASEVYPDVYATPAYGRSAMVIDDGIWECAVDHETGYAYPYVVRPVEGTELADIVTPYGYSGPFRLDGGELEAKGLADFRYRFLAAARERGYVAEFVRGHPLDLTACVEAMGFDLVTTRTTFAIDGSADNYWSACEGRHRTAVRKARREGATVIKESIATTTDPSSPFRIVYDNTMRRVDASDDFLLDDRYFEALTALDDGASVRRVEVQGETIAAAIFLRWRGRLHYHLSGSTRMGMRIGAANIMLDAAYRDIADEAFMHLGGGLREGDGLARFKASIATRRLEVKLGRTVIDPDAYRALVGRPSVLDEHSYFPAYRG